MGTTPQEKDLTKPGINKQPPPPNQERNFLDHLRIRRENLIAVLQKGNSRSACLLLSRARASLLLTALPGCSLPTTPCRPRLQCVLPEMFLKVLL